MMENVNIGTGGVGFSDWLDDDVGVHAIAPVCPIALERWNDRKVAAQMWRWQGVRHKASKEAA